MLFPGGFDGTAEELHKYGIRTALELGWNAVAWDGPGQGGLLVEHGVPMRPDFETVLTPVVEWALQQPFVDPRRLVLVRDREFYGARMAAMGAATFGEWLRVLTGYTLAGRAERISCPTLVTEGEGDFASQSHTLFDALTCEKQFHAFTASEGAGGHCEGWGSGCGSRSPSPGSAGS